MQILSRARRGGNHPGASRHPSQEGNCPPVTPVQFATYVQPPIPSVEGCRPQAAGWFPPRRNPRPNPFPSWEGCPRRGGVVVPRYIRPDELLKGTLSNEILTDAVFAP
ncbi:MAG: hypothetical protein LBM98_09990 [Oscillospiraceae bacterium]|nr:hypothetical protein [Oscillospiraceae bacterium]